LILELCDLKDKVDTAHKLLDKSINDYENKNIIDLLEDIENIKLSLKSLPEILPLLNELNETSRNFQAFIKSGKFSPEQFEKLMAEKSLKTVYNGNKEFHKTEASDIKYSINKLKQAFEKLYEINASYIRAKIRKKFNDNIALSIKSATGMSSQEKEFKKLILKEEKL